MKIITNKLPWLKLNWPSKTFQTFDGVLGLGQPRLKLHLGMLEVVDLGNGLSFIPRVKQD